MTDPPDDLADVHRRLDAARPDDSPDAVTRASQRARARVGRARQRPALRLRAAIVTLLIAGFTFTGAGAAFAVGGIGGRQLNAAQDQYGTQDATPPDSQVAGSRDPGPTGTTGQPPTPGAPTIGGDENGDGDVGDSCSITRPVARGTTNDGCPQPGAGTRGSQDTGGPGTSAGTGQTSRQVEASTRPGGTLPYTGWAALPVLGLGLALLVAGFALRRRTRVA